MEKFFKSIVKHKKTILIVFIVCTILSVFMATQVGVNYDFADYLPESSGSTIALELLNKEYVGGIPNVRVMVTDVTIPEALEIKEHLYEIDGITDVMWLDTAVNINIPLETIDKDVLENYYKDNTALFSVTIDEEKAMDCLKEIKKVTDKDFYMSGEAVNLAIATETTGPQIAMVMGFVIPLVFIILLFTTSSWFEPVLFMITIGIAIVINNGTNLFFGEISFVTSAASSILQLAVSMDYSIFLLHRFADYRKEGMDVESAMVMALRKSFSSITASGLTTVIGFAALILMQFKIGPDMGLVMAKAILLSMITVLVFLPVLAIICYKLIDKTHHRPLMPSFKKLSKFIVKVRVPALIIFVILMVPCYLAQNNNAFSYGSSEIFGENTDVYKETKIIEDTFGKSNQMVLLVPKGEFAKETALSNELHNIPQISSILSYVDLAGAEIPAEYLDEATLSKLISENYSRMVLTINTDFEGEEAFSIVEQIKEISSKYYENEYHLTGSTVVSYDMMNITTLDMARVNFVAIAAVFIVILLTMKSGILPVILVLVIETAIWINLSFPYFMDAKIFYIAYLIISSVQLGATVDYAILMGSRYIETRRTREKKDALLHTLRHTILPILTSATIMFLGGLMIGVISTHGVIAELGILVCRGSLLSGLLVLFVLPAFLYLLDRPIRATTIGAKKEID